MSRPNAILLLGPTGSGKTPLGDTLQGRGLGSARCEHFDFGSRLRQVAAGTLNVPDLTDADQAFIVDVLHRGALLEDEHFPIARKILLAFIEERQASQPATGHELPATIVLNGLPRHVGQADDVDRIVDVTTVVELSCTPETVMARLKADTGGDRAGRTDDDPALVARKLETYTRRTEPLVEHYRRRGAAVLCLPIGPRDSAEDVWSQLRKRWA